MRVCWPISHQQYWIRTALANLNAVELQASSSSTGQNHQWPVASLMVNQGLKEGFKIWFT